MKPTMRKWEIDLQHSYSTEFIYLFGGGVLHDSEN